MNGFRVFVCLSGLLGLTAAGTSQVILSVDFNDRGADPATFTQPGFQPFVIGSSDGAALQTNASTTAFGPLSVTISGNGTNPSYDDRQRAAPTDTGDFTQSLLLRDFVFTPSTSAGGGLDLRIEGLAANQVVLVTIWSYDDTSSGANPRVSDWYANGTLVRDNYSFNGGSANRPTNNLQYQFSFKATANDSGLLLIQGRRDAATGANPGVFLNAFQIEHALPDPPQPVIQPPPQVYAGDNTILYTQTGGTPPFTFQWLKNSDPIPDATNSSLTIFNTQITDLANYSIIASNSAGAVTSAVVSITTFLPVVNLTSGLISHWPFDEASTFTPDVSTNQNHLFLTNMLSTNLVAGRVGNALAFDGTTQFVSRATSETLGLPICTYPAYTVAFWVKGDFTGQNDRRVYAEGSTTNNNPIFSIGTHNQGSNGTVDIFIRNTDGVTPINHRHSTNVAFDNTWHHIAWVDNNSYPSLYIDGVLDPADFNYTRGLLIPNTVAVGGLLRATPVSWFGGTVDQVAVWRRSLTASEVQQVFTSGPPAPLDILTIQVNGSSVTLTFHTPEPASTHQVLETTDLVDPEWTQVQNVLFSANGNTITAQFTTPAISQRFYRVTY